jgi:hypothetical protein
LRGGLRHGLRDGIGLDQCDLDRDDLGWRGLLHAEVSEGGEAGEMDAGDEDGEQYPARGRTLQVHHRPEGGAHIGSRIICRQRRERGCAMRRLRRSVRERSGWQGLDC